jgi:hypothetical protein
MKTNRENATNAHEAFKSVRQGILNHFNDPDVEREAEDWLYWCDKILRAERGMADANSIIRASGASK